jgi:hypothetical protein
VKWLRQKLIERFCVKKSLRDESPAAIEDPLVGEHEKPGLELSFLRIELLDGPKDIKKDLLDGIFGFRVIAQGASCYPEKAWAVPLEQYCQSICVSALQMLDQCFV